jgi:hypothetical protein
MPDQYGDDLFTMKIAATQAWVLQHYAKGLPAPVP